MKYYIVFITLMINVYGYSQEKSVFVNKKVDDFITNLSLKEVDKIIVSDTYTSSMSAYEENCLIPVFEKVDITSVKNHSDYFTYFVIWTNNDQVFIKKIDFCTEYEVISFENKDLELKIKNADFNAIYKEDILPNQYIEDGIAYYNLSSCGTPEEIFFYSKEIKFSKSINYSNNLSKENNINYKYNSELDLVQLDDLVTNVIKEFDMNNKFLPKN